MNTTLSPERQHHVGGSEVASLWNQGWETRYGLYARKAGLLPHDKDSDVVQLRLGQILEPAVAQAVMEETNWQLNKVHRYTKHKTVEGMGASLDYEIVAHADGVGVCQIKTVDQGYYRRAWAEGQPPIQYELQLQHEIACRGAKWGVLAVLISNRALKIFTRKREAEAIAMIEREIPIFWAEVAARTPPAPDYRVDSELLIELFKSTTKDKAVDLSMDDEAHELALSYDEWAQKERDAKKAKEQLKARLLAKMGDAEVAVLPHGKITSRHIPAAPREFTMPAYRSWHVTVEDVDG